jgi:hypothetical protein
VRAISSSTASPRACTPSSLVMRMRIGTQIYLL